MSSAGAGKWGLTISREACKIYCSMERENEKYILCEFTEKCEAKSGRVDLNKKKRCLKDGKESGFGRIDRSRFRW